MFTGIIRQIGAVAAVRPGGGGKRLTVDLGPLTDGCGVGDSVAVAGVCLTVCEIDGPKASFDVQAETLGRTTLGRLGAGAAVNLERPVAAGAPLDGHIVQGHVDGVASVRSVRTAGGHVVEFSAAPELTGQMVAKGSVAIDGVSLTLVDVGQDAFSVALIPETLAATTLGSLKAGDEVNIELDILGKYVRRYLRQVVAGGAEAGGLTLEKLRQAGFV